MNRRHLHKEDINAIRKSYYESPVENAGLCV